MLGTFERTDHWLKSKFAHKNYYILFILGHGIVAYTAVSSFKPGSQFCNKPKPKISL